MLWSSTIRPVLGQKGVGDVGAVAGADCSVEERRRQVVCTNEGCKALLELLAGDPAPERHVGERSPQSAGAALAAVPVEEGGEGEGIGQPARFCLVQRADQGIVVEDGCEVEQRPRHGRDQDPVAYGAFVGGEVRAVELDRRMGSALRGNRDRGLALPRAQTPFRPCGAVAENGSGAEADDGGQQPRLPVGVRIGHRVDTRYIRCSSPARARRWIASALAPRSMSCQRATTPCCAAASSAIRASR